MLQLLLTLCDPTDCSLPGSCSWGFSRLEYLSGLLCPPPGDLPDTGMEALALVSAALAGGFFTASTTWEAFTSLKPFFLHERVSCTFCPLLPKEPGLKAVSAPFRGRKQTQKLNLLQALPSDLTGIHVYIPLAPTCAKCVGSPCRSWATADGYCAVGIDWCDLNDVNCLLQIRRWGDSPHPHPGMRLQLA